VSVVIPCYNQAKYLERCIDSIKKQTEKDVEIIVVDDGSPDDVQGEVKRLQTERKWRIKLIVQKNKGLPGARNTGFTKAKAEWVLPLDADDQLQEDNYLETCLNAASPKSGVVFTDGISLSGKQTISVVDEPRLRLENTMHACQMIRRYVWARRGGYNLLFQKGYEDWEFWVNCLEHGVEFTKASGVHLLIDDQHEGRMTPVVQKAENYFELLAIIKDLHPKFFGLETPEAEPLPERNVCSLTVVLSSYNQRNTLPLVLESYKHQTALPQEVIINDDGSTDGTLEYLDSLTDLPFDLRYVTREHSWYRLASGNNSAAKYARGERILFTNGDQLHCPTSFEAHCSLPTVRVGGGVFKGIHVAHSSKVSLEMVADWEKLKAIQEQFPSHKNNLPHIETTDPNHNPIGVWGGNFSVPSKVFREIGGYDEGYDVGWGGEENDLVRRCVKAGCRVEWVRGSEIFHLDHPIRAYAHSMLGSQKYVKDMT
jgi:glycosyltransferase involved in cell wall biosynthesis